MNHDLPQQVTSLEDSVTELANIQPTLDTDAVGAATESMMERLDYELLAAWRMGYDYAYIWTKHQTKDWDGDWLDSFEVEIGVLPSNDPDWHPSRELGVVEQYDLRELTREQVRAVKR